MSEPSHTGAIHRKVAQINGIRLFYLDSETPGPTILCLHGRFGRAETWMGMFNRYAQHYRVIAPDQRGHGLSDQPVDYYRSETLAEDAAALLDYCNVDAAITVGHSMGGRIAAYMAAMFPEKVSALAVLDQSAAWPTTPSTLPLDELPHADSFTAAWPLPFPSSGVARDYLTELTGSALRAEYYLQSLTETDDGFVTLFSQQATAAIYEYQEDWFHLLPKIHQPVILVRARNSEHLPDEDCERMLSALTSATAVEVSAPDHHVYLSNPEEFYTAFDGFLRASNAN